MAYRKTSTKILFSMVDETAKDDAAYDSSHATTQTGCDLDKLSSTGRIDDYMTNELNYSILDSSKRDFGSADSGTEDFSKYAFVSNFASDNLCSFSQEKYLRIIFDDFHTINGITITFDGDYYPDKIRVIYYNSTSNNHRIINSKEFTVTENICFCDSGGSVENFKEIRIYFLSTKYPNSLIKISKIVYGADYVWDNDNIISADIFEEADIISNTLSIGTCRFTLYSDKDDFNIENPMSIYSAIKKNQKVEVYEIIENYDDYSNLIGDPYEIFMGRYYIKQWNATEKHSITFECVDLIGVLDDIPFFDGRTTQQNTFGNIISWIIEATGLGNNIIQLQNGLSNKQIRGILPVCTCREALQMACFAINAHATCNRRRNIYVSINNKSISYNISDENNFGVISSAINPIVTGIKYPSFVYTSMGGEVKSVFCEKQVTTGQKTIIVDNVSLPFSLADISINTTQGTARGVLVNKVETQTDQHFIHAHKIIVNVTRSGTLVVDGFPYEKNLKTFVKKIENIDSAENIIDISNINLYETVNSESDDIAIVDKLLAYYSKRNTCEYEFKLTEKQVGNNIVSETSGNWCLFKNMYGDEILGNIFSMTIDLTGGFISKTKMVCCENLSNLTYTYICGNEIISGENIGII